MTADKTIDLEWLRAQVVSLLEKNSVKDIRVWNRASHECLYHAPSLNTALDHPSGFLKKLMGVGEWLWQLALPTRVRYPHQWFWDSCAHAIVLSHIKSELACKEIESLLYAQTEDGFIPHMVWNPQRMHWVDRLANNWFFPRQHCSPYLQPPVLAIAAEIVYQSCQNPDFLQKILPALTKYYRYLEKTRDLTGDGLLEIIISYESGKDRSPEYDVVYGESSAVPAWYGPMVRLMLDHKRLGWDLGRIFASNRFRVKDLLFNCVYAQGLAALSRLCRLAGKAEDASSFRNAAQKTEAAILSKMYDAGTGLFFSLDARHGRDTLIKVNTISTLMPLFLDTITGPQIERLVKESLLNPGEFWAKFPLPVEPLSSLRKTANQHIVFRGPQTWVYTDWFIVRGLRKQAERFPEHRSEYLRIADEIALSIYHLVRGQGFREFYDARNGTPCGAYDFGWTTLVLDMLTPPRP